MKSILCGALVPEKGEKGEKGEKAETEFCGTLVPGVRCSARRMPYRPLPCMFSAKSVVSTRRGRDQAQPNEPPGQAPNPSMRTTSPCETSSGRTSRTCNVGHISQVLRSDMRYERRCDGPSGHQSRRAFDNVSAVCSQERTLVNLRTRIRARSSPRSHRDERACTRCRPTKRSQPCRRTSCPASWISARRNQ